MEQFTISTEEALILFDEPNVSHQILMTLAIRNAIEMAIRRESLYAFQAPGLTFEQRDEILSEVKQMLDHSPQPTTAYENLKADMAQIRQYEKQFSTVSWFKRFSLAIKIKALKQNEYPLGDVLRGLFCEFKTINRMTVFELVGNDFIIDEDEEI